MVGMVPLAVMVALVVMVVERFFILPNYIRLTGRTPKSIQDFETK